MDRAWKDRTSKDPQYAYKRAFAKDAFLAECWVFSENSNKIYSPEEFMLSNEVVHIHRGHPIDRKFKIIKPDILLNQKIEQANKLLAEIADIQFRMKDYYELSRKKGK